MTIALNDPDATALKAHFEKVGLLGRATGTPPSKSEIEDVVFKAIAIRSRESCSSRKGNSRSTWARSGQIETSKALHPGAAGKAFCLDGGWLPPSKNVGCLVLLGPPPWPPFLSLQLDSKTGF